MLKLISSTLHAIKKNDAIININEVRDEYKYLNWIKKREREEKRVRERVKERERNGRKNGRMQERKRKNMREWTSVSIEKEKKYVIILLVILLSLI